MAFDTAPIQLQRAETLAANLGQLMRTKFKVSFDEESRSFDIESDCYGEASFSFTETEYFHFELFGVFFGDDHLTWLNADREEMFPSIIVDGDGTLHVADRHLYVDLSAADPAKVRAYVFGRSMAIFDMPEVRS